MVFILRIPLLLNLIPFSCDFELDKNPGRVKELPTARSTSFCDCNVFPVCCLITPNLVSPIPVKTFSGGIVFGDESRSLIIF